MRDLYQAVLLWMVVFYFLLGPLQVPLLLLLLHHLRFLAGLDVDMVEEVDEDGDGW